MKLSLILPCYNVDKYIDICLKSIYSQDIPENEYEVICVNDCSIDNTVEIIEEYKRKHSNLILLHHDVNRNLGASRNTGFRIAKGKYVWFIDPDDFIAENCLNSILFELENNRLDALEINSNLTNPIRNPHFLETNFNVDSNVMKGTDYLIYLMNSTSWGRKVEVWRRIFNREFLLTNKLDFSETLFGVEDVILFYQTFVVCRRFKHLAEYCYTYNNDRDESITNSNNNRGLKLAVRIIVTVRVIEFFRNESIMNDPEFNQKAISTYQWSLRQILKRIYVLDRKNLREYFTKIDPYIAYIREQSTWYEANLTTNRILVKSINAILIPIKKLRNFIKNH